MDFSLLSPKDREHFAIFFREIKKIPGTSKYEPNIDSKRVPDELYFSPIQLPSSNLGIEVNQLSPGPFVQGVVDSLTGLEPTQKNVLLYIHGFQLMPGLKMSRLDDVVGNYFVHPTNNLAKVIMFSWPSNGGRKTADDRALEYGQKFTNDGHFQLFADLSKALRDKGFNLNLIVHSFGHQLLNGMLNPLTRDSFDEPIFNNVFLVGSDITQHSVKEGGVQLRNFYTENEDPIDHITYDLSKLGYLANNVRVIYDHYDFLLYVSTVKSLNKGRFKDMPSNDERERYCKNYLNLGDFGNENISGYPPNFHFYNMEDLPEIDGAYPIKSINNYGPLDDDLVEDVDRTRSDFDFSRITDTDVIFNVGQLQRRHKYFFTCERAIRK
ncbi:MAG: alpha/beta hydrolase, partial [Cyclobacteriaceae bacterium]|nr:alpha/beta hydrolase [Cyclobacteriaceae bacterium HetDA_MAG_MS6]